MSWKKPERRVSATGVSLGLGIRRIRPRSATSFGTSRSLKSIAVLLGAKRGEVVADFVQPGVPTLGAHRLAPFGVRARLIQRLGDSLNELFLRAADAALAENLDFRHRGRYDRQPGRQVLASFERIG